MQKYNSTDSYRNAVAQIRRSHVSYGQPLRTVTFEGTIKLHGTNAGVRIRKDSIMPQSRERLLDIGCDNAGFAHFALGHEDYLRSLGEFIARFNNLTVEDASRYTIFGEWCGGNIQSKVGLNSLDKHFVVFQVFDHETERYINRDWMRVLLESDILTAKFNMVGIHFIYEVAPFELTINFAEPEQYTAELERLTLEVEESCPWTAYRGGAGIGEGIVWAEKGNEGDPRFWFKTKGVKHQGKDESRVKTLSADPVKVAEIRTFVASLLPEWRLEQGVSVMRERGNEISQKSTGLYLKWINEDILKEEATQIAANAWTWKELSPYVNQKAKDYFFTTLDTEAFTS